MHRVMMHFKASQLTPELILPRACQYYSYRSTRYDFPTRSHTFQRPQVAFLPRAALAWLRCTRKISEYLAMVRIPTTLKHLGHSSAVCTKTALCQRGSSICNITRGRNVQEQGVSRVRRGHRGVGRSWACDDYRRHV